MNGSNVRGSLAPYVMVTSSLVQMEYLLNKEYFPFKTVIIDDSLQITLVEKKKPSVIWNLFDFITYVYSYYSQLQEAIYFSYS